MEKRLTDSEFQSLDAERDIWLGIADVHLTNADEKGKKGQS